MLDEGAIPASPIDETLALEPDRRLAIVRDYLVRAARALDGVSLPPAPASSADLIGLILLEQDIWL